MFTAERPPVRRS